VARIALLKEIKSGFDLHKNGLHAFREGKPGQQKKQQGGPKVRGIKPRNKGRKKAWETPKQRRNLNLNPKPNQQQRNFSPDKSFSHPTSASQLGSCI